MPYEGQIPGGVVIDYVADIRGTLDNLSKTLSSNGVVPGGVLQDAIARLSGDASGLANQLTQGASQLAALQAQLTDVQRQLSQALTNAGKGGQPSATPPGAVTATGQQLKPGTYVTAQATAGIAAGGVALGLLGGYFLGQSAAKKKGAREGGLTGTRENPLALREGGLRWDHVNRGRRFEADGTRGYYVVAAQRHQHDDNDDWFAAVTKPDFKNLGKFPTEAAAKARAEQYERTGR